MKKRINIEGMSCGHCVKHVKDALVEVSGVVDAEVSLEGKYAVVELNGQVDDGSLTEAVEEAGYDVVNISDL